MATKAIGDVGYRMFVVSYRSLLVNTPLSSDLQNVPGNRNNGYGLVVMPMLISVFSGLSYIFASQ